MLSTKMLSKHTLAVIHICRANHSKSSAATDSYKKSYGNLSHTSGTSAASERQMARNGKRRQFRCESRAPFNSDTAVFTTEFALLMLCGSRRNKCVCFVCAWICATVSFSGKNEEKLVFLQDCHLQLICETAVFALWVFQLQQEISSQSFRNSRIPMQCHESWKRWIRSRLRLLSLTNSNSNPRLMKLLPNDSWQRQLPL